MELTINKINSGFLAESLVAASAGGDKYKAAVPSLEFLVFDNTDGTTPKNITIKSVTDCNQGHNHDVSVAVGAGERGYKAHHPKERFADAGGYINIEYDDVTDLKVGVFKII